MRQILIAVLSALPVMADAQTIIVVPLRPADAMLDEEFTYIGSVRELRDGRVLITDPRENRVVVADLRANRVEPVGRPGHGPEEYGSALALHPLAGDSSIMFDLLGRRWLLFDGARIVVTMPPDAPAVQATSGLGTGADALGFVTGVGRGPSFAGTRDYGKGDSSTVIRVARKTGKVDTLARLRSAPAHAESQVDAKGNITSMSIRRSPLAVGEESLLFRDGWLAVARLEPYRIDWRSPDGHWTLGRPLPVSVVKMTAREKQASMERTAKSSGRPARSPDTVKDWPDELPPYSTRPFVAAPDGRLLVLKQPSADHPETRYDVVDRRGVLLGQITMPDTERIIGAGARSVYVAVKDENDIERLRRHPWPMDRPIAP
jgi:hypothetical protein